MTGLIFEINRWDRGTHSRHPEHPVGDARNRERARHVTATPRSLTAAPLVCAENLPPRSLSAHLREAKRHDWSEEHRTAAPVTQGGGFPLRMCGSEIGYRHLR